jgi:ATP-dependent Clp protease ATP-binding subunit ClpC
VPLFGRLSSSLRMNGYNFTERVRQILAAAREEAARLRHEYVGTEHILLALLADEGGVSAAVLTNLGVDREAVRALIEATVKTGNADPHHGPDLPYTSRAKRVLELAMAESRELHHTYVGSEHLLLGLVAEGKGIAAQVLQDSGVTLEGARAEARRLLGTPQEQPAAEARVVPLVAPPRLPAAQSLADRGREELAWTRLRNALDASARLGGPATVELQPDGTLAVALGPDLVVSVEFPPSVGLRRRAEPA